MTGGGSLRAAAVALVVALVAGACLSDAPEPSSPATDSPQPEATPTVTTYRLDTTTWYGGFVLTLKTVTAKLDPKGGPVALALALRNPGPDDATLDGPIVLRAGSRTVEPDRDSTLPVVPVGGTTFTSLVFDVDAGFDVPAASIVVGRVTEHQAVAPLVPGSVEVVTLEPRTAALDLTGQAGALRITLLGLELRADLPDWRQELEPDLLALTLTYDATYRSSFVGGFAFTADNVALRLPDGTTISPRRDGHSQSTLVIAPGNREPGLQSRFEVPAPGDGAYVLVISDGSAKKELPFEIAAP